MHPFPVRQSKDRCSGVRLRTSINDSLAMQATAPAPRHRVYTAVEPRCEWARAADADTLVVDVSGFMKEELRVLYNTSRKLKVAGERPVGSDGSGARWARFLKSFPVPKSVRTGGIRAVMDKEQAVLYVILPKGSAPPPPAGPPPPPPPQPSPSMATQKEQPQPGSALPPPHGEQKGDGDGSSGGNGSFWSAQEDAEKKRAQEKEMAPKETRIQIQEEEIATPDAPRNDGGDGDKRWWEKLTPLHVVGFVVLVLAVVGAAALYAMLLL